MGYESSTYWYDPETLGFRHLKALRCMLFRKVTYVWETVETPGLEEMMYIKL